MKFKEDDWIIINDIPYYIVETTENGKYLLEFQDGNRELLAECLMPTDARLWTIEDAKEGDLLTDKDGCVCVFDYIRETNDEWKSILFCHEDYVSSSGGVHDITGTCPATYWEKERMKDVIERSKKPNAYSGIKTYGITFSGYIARDKDGSIFLHSKKPFWCETLNEWSNIEGSKLKLQKSLFPEIICQDDPIEVKVEITRKV